MGMKPRRKPETKKTCKVTIKRSDGYESVADGVSYEAGLAISVILNRDGMGDTIVSWDEDGEVQSVEVPKR